MLDTRIFSFFPQCFQKDWIVQQTENIGVHFQSILPDDKISALSKSKAFADNKLYIYRNIKFVFHRIKTLCGK